MHYQLNVRAATKEGAKANLANAFAGQSENLAPHSPDWSTPTTCANAIIDSLEDSETLDAVVTVTGEINFEGDGVQFVNFSCLALLTDRVA